MTNDEGGAEISAGVSAEERDREQAAKLKSPFRQVPIAGELANSAVTGTNAAGGPVVQSGMAPGVAASGGGFTQLFQTLASDGERSASAEDAAGFRGEPLPRAAAAGADAEGGPGVAPAKGGGSVPRRGGTGAAERRGAGDFTRMFERLGSEGAPPAGPPPMRSQPAAAGFTQLLQTLSEDDVPRDQAVPAAAMAAPRSAAGGPGEFTRVISGSMLREAQGKMALSMSPNGRAATPATVQPEQAAGAAAANAEPAEQGAVRSETSRAPSVAVPMSAMPQPASLARDVWMWAAAGTAEMGHVSVPSLPSMPQIQVGVQPRSAGGEGWQRYLPLLLITNLFLMVLVLIALGLLLYRH